MTEDQNEQRGLPKLLRRAIEGMRESVMITDSGLVAPGPRILFVNRAFTEMTGHRAEDVLFRSPRILQGPNTDRRTLQRLKEQLLVGKSFEGRAINYRKNGEPFVIEWYIEPIFGDDGRPLHFMAVQRDVSHEEEREVALRRLHSAFEHVDEAVVVLSDSGCMQYCNRAAKLMFPRGVSLPSETWTQLRAGVSWKGSLRASVSGESRHLSAEVRPVPGVYPGEQNYVVTASDVTEVERLQSIARSVNLSDNIGHFLAGIRHELGNPTNSVKTALTVLRANLTSFGEDKTREYLDHVLDEVGRIEHLLRALRSFTAHESVRLEKSDVGRLIDKVANLVRIDMDRAQVELSVAPPPSGTIFVDGRAFYQIFINLVSNAIEAVAGVEKAKVRIEYARTPGRIEIMVVDNGVGICESQVQKVIQPFYTTKRTGTGLGLAIVQRLLERHDGTLQLKGNPEGQGSRAIVSLPFSPSEQRSRDETAERIGR